MAAEAEAELEIRRKRSSLINRNVIIDGHRTSVRLESEMWNDLRDICRREGKTLHEICTIVNEHRPLSRSLTSAIRVFLIAYYRSAATEEGHNRAGHGEGYRIASRVVPEQRSVASFGRLTTADTRLDTNREMSMVASAAGRQSSGQLR